MLAVGMARLGHAGGGWYDLLAGWRWTGRPQPSTSSAAREMLCVICQLCIVEKKRPFAQKKDRAGRGLACRRAVQHERRVLRDGLGGVRNRNGYGQTKRTRQKMRREADTIALQND